MRCEVARIWSWHSCRRPNSWGKHFFMTIFKSFFLKFYEICRLIYSLAMLKRFRYSFVTQLFTFQKLLGEAQPAPRVHHLGLRWRSGQSARLSPLRLRVRFSERTFSMLLEPSALLMWRVSQHSAESRGFSPGAPVSSHREVDRVG